VRVQPFEFDTGVFGRELPVGLGVVLVSMVLPGCYLFFEGVLKAKPALWREADFA
jgi:hypothetical protein